MALIEGELSSRRRWLYRCVLTVAVLGLAALLSVWLTEREPLPTRLHIAFSGLAVVLVGWIGVLCWILMRRNCPTASDRVATGWMATLASALFLGIGFPVAWLRGGPTIAAALGLSGATLLVIAVVTLWRAYRLRRRLQRLAAELDETAK